MPSLVVLLMEKTCQYIKKNEMFAQISGLGNKYVKHAQYAKASIQDMFGQKTISNALTKKCYQLESSFFYARRWTLCSKILTFKSTSRSYFWNIVY